MNSMAVLMVDGSILKLVNNFKYLGTAIISDGRSEMHI
jgi:hypothetical protein